MLTDEMKQAMKAAADEALADRMRDEGCPTCGAAVADPRKHVDWHNNLDKLIASAAKTATVSGVDMRGMRL